MPEKPFNPLDAIRCLLIALVVVVHTVHFGELHPDIKDAINFFFMPAFLIVTGYLVRVDVSAGRFGLYVLRIALPYVIMSLGFAALSLFLPVADGISEPSVGEFARVIFLEPIGPYWYLHTMIVCGVLCYLAHVVAARLGVAGEMCVFGLLLCLVALFSPVLVLLFAASYFLGAALRRGGAEFGRVFPASAWAVLPFVVLIGWGRESGGALSVFGLAACFFCFVSWVWGLLGGRAAEWVGYVGRNTLPIYLFHPIFTMIGKFALPLFAWDPTGVAHMLFVLVLAICGSLALAHLMDRTGLSRIFAREKMLR